MRKALNWNDLLASLNDSKVKPEEKGWNIFYYLSENIGKMNQGNTDDNLSSEVARMLLLIYIKLPLERPSLLHSVMLGIALKMAVNYADFKLSEFLKMWDVQNLRKEDYERLQNKQGKSFYSLADSLAKYAVRHQLYHPDEAFDSQAMNVIEKTAAKLGFLPIMQMVAVKMWETVSNGNKIRFVKLVSPKGDEISTDWHLFHTNIWDIVGQMYDVLPRRSAKTGNIHVDSIVRSTRKVEDVFGKRIGYVDYFDEQHKHYHIFDSDSRHFVAESPKIRPSVGSYVWFSPIIPATDKFKSAIVLRGENINNARQTFGITNAHVISVNEEKGYFLFQTDDDRIGLCDLKHALRPLIEGDEVCLILFMKRYSKDGEKRLHVAEMI